MESPKNSTASWTLGRGGDSGTVPFDVRWRHVADVGSTEKDGILDDNLEKHLIFFLVGEKKHWDIGNNSILENIEI